MKKFFKPACLVFYILTLFSFFFIGMLYAGYSGAAEGQGLAGGAIVFGYGVISGGIAFIAAIIFGHQIPPKTLSWINGALFLFLVLSFGRTYYQFKQREKQRNEEQPLGHLNKQRATTSLAVLAKGEAAPIAPESPEKERKKMGLGFFAPHYNDHRVLNFYSGLNPEKSLDEHLPIDSIRFERGEFNQLNITSAPPWLVPEMMKLDYGLLYFKVESISSNFIEVVGNATSGKRVFVDRHAGKMIYWPEFLLGVHSVERLEKFDQAVRIKALDHASTVSTAFEFMRPLKIKDQWMEVELQDKSFKKVGTGWIQWRSNDGLLIKYSMLS